jgi:SAM-dependent methyltransferase
MDNIKQRLARHFPGAINALRRLHRKTWRLMSMEYVFTKTHEHGGWGCGESVSGKGSSLAETRGLRTELPILLKELSVTSVLDIPCGDFNWMKEIAPVIPQYVGADVVRDLVDRNNQRYASANVRFVFADAMKSELPRVDVIICRDMLVHFPFRELFRTLRNFKASGSTFLLATTFTSHETNTDIDIAEWRPLNLQRPPFNFPKPVRLIVEGCETKPDKSLGLWRLQELPNEIARG